MHFDERLKQIENSIGNQKTDDVSKNEMLFKELALRASTDMVSALIVGSFLGWGLDYSLSSSPWGLIGGFLLGTFSGLWTIYKTLLKKNG